MEEIKKGYKGFSRGLVCRGKQYEENTIYEEANAVICKSGMHFCENPMDVLDHYGFMDDNGNMNEFAEVEALDECFTDDNKKYCTKKLKVGAKLTLQGFIKACVDFLIEKTTVEVTDKTMTVSEERYAQLAASGDAAQLAASGDAAQLAASGDAAKLAASGDAAQLAASGYAAKLAASGYAAKLAASGDAAQVESTGQDSVICCAGCNARAKAMKGSWITLAEWKWSDSKSRYVPVCVKTEFVDGDKIKENTWYKIKNGEFIEA